MRLYLLLNFKILLDHWYSSWCLSIVLKYNSPPVWQLLIFWLLASLLIDVLAHVPFNPKIDCRYGTGCADVLPNEPCWLCITHLLLFCLFSKYAYLLVITTIHFVQHHFLWIRHKFLIRGMYLNISELYWNFVLCQLLSKYMNSWCVYCIVKIKSILNQKTTKLFLRFTKPSRKFKNFVENWR